MNSESIDFDLVKAERRESAKETMEAVTHDDLVGFRSRLFPMVDHPWQTVYDEFIAAHKLSPAVHGHTSDGIEFIFFPIEKKGLWFHYADGVQGIGPIQERGLNTLANIAAEKKLDI